MSGYAEYSKQLLNQYPNTHKVPLVKATTENFKKYGKFVYDYDNEKVQLVTWPAPGFRPIMYGTGFGGGIPLVESRARGVWESWCRYCGGSERGLFGS